MSTSMIEPVTEYGSPEDAGEGVIRDFNRDICGTGDQRKSLPISRAEANSPYLFPLHDGSVSLHLRVCPWTNFDVSIVFDVVIT